DDLDGARFDLVISVNASARLQLDAATLARLRDLLAPGGVLLAVEPEPNPFWDIIFGQHAQWWEAGAPDGEGSPLRSADDWRSEMAIAGFAALGTIPVASGPWPSLALWARAPA